MIEYNPRIGERVIYKGGWGMDAPVVCKCTGAGMKNGRPVYDNDLGHWGYADQYEAFAGDVKTPKTGKTA